MWGWGGNKKHWGWKHVNDSPQWSSKPSFWQDLTIPLNPRLLAISLQEEPVFHWGWRFSRAYDKGIMKFHLKDNMGGDVIEVGISKGWNRCFYQSMKGVLFIGWHINEHTDGNTDKQAFSSGLGLWAQRSKTEVDAQLSWSGCDS